MKAYKGFDKDLKCRGFQYEVGKEYKEDKAELCECGFHACEEPLDVLSYYFPNKSRYCEVELDNVTEEKCNKVRDSKRVGKNIKINKEISITELVNKQIDYILENKSQNYLEDIEPYKLISSRKSKAVIVSHGYQSKSILTSSNAGVCISEHSGVSIAGQNSASFSGDEGISIVSNRGIAVAKNRGLAYTGNQGKALTSAKGISIAGYYGKAISGANGFSIAPDGGIAISEKEGISIGNLNSFEINMRRHNLFTILEESMNESISGDYGITISSENSSTGKKGLSIGIGSYARVKGKLGSILMIDQREKNENDNTSTIDQKWKAVEVDGVNIKEDTWYELVDGEFKEIKEDNK